VSAERTMLDRGGSKKSVFGRTSFIDDPLVDISQFCISVK